MIRAENLTKSFGEHVLLDGVSFAVGSRERVGLVGRNGHGKTTLLRLIIGEEHADAGGIVVPKGYRLGYVQQQIAFKEKTVLEEGARGLPPDERDQFWRIEKILAGLGFSDEDLRRDPRTLSGGYQVRLNLAKVLVSEPDLLLLDEPTNYLDITSIRWVAHFLKRWPREVLLITHDRSFMDSVVTHVMGIHRRKIRKVPGTTEKYYALIAQEEEVYEKTRLNDERRRREIELFISRFRAKARLANLVQSRIKTLSKLEKREKLEAARMLEFVFRSAPFRGRQMLQVENLAFAYPGKPRLVEDFSFTARAGERIAVIGRNGRGKTTLLKLLAGTLSPDKGQIRYNPAVIKGVYEQTNISTLVDSRTVEEEILYAHPDISRQLARNICGAMLFSGDDALKKIRVLSGGEKSRVMLGRLLATPVNLLLLDEPTNHLDMESCDALLAALDNFDGTLIMVTHNEMFLHALAQRLVVFGERGPQVFDGSYQRFLESGGWQEDGAGPGDDPVTVAGGENAMAGVGRKELRRRRSRLIEQRARELKPVNRQIRAAEEKIEKLEAVLTELGESMRQASLAQDGDRIASLSKAIHVRNREVDDLYGRLEALYQQREQREADFNRRLGALGID
jgi:ATP-binding cassette subfamily F protein 3